jgi:hypothetical protein
MKDNYGVTIKSKNPLNNSSKIKVMNLSSFSIVDLQNLKEKGYKFTASFYKKEK